MEALFVKGEVCRYILYGVSGSGKLWQESSAKVVSEQGQQDKVCFEIELFYFLHFVFCTFSQIKAELVFFLLLFGMLIGIIYRLG